MRRQVSWLVKALDAETGSSWRLLVYRTPCSDYCLWPVKQANEPATQLNQHFRCSRPFSAMQPCHRCCMWSEMCPVAGGKYPNQLRFMLLRMHDAELKSSSCVTGRRVHTWEAPTLAASMPGCTLLATQVQAKAAENLNLAVDNRHYWNIDRTASAMAKAEVEIGSTWNLYVRFALDLTSLAANLILGGTISGSARAKNIFLQLQRWEMFCQQAHCRCFQIYLV